MNKRIIMIATISLILDQVTKVIAENVLSLYQSHKVISNFFYLTLCHNKGAAFSILESHSYIIIIGTIIAFILLYHFMCSFKKNTLNDVAFGLLLGGLAGNLIDRIFLGYVRDFLDFYIFKYDYPVFNIADITIVIGVFLLIISILKGGDKNDNKSNTK